MTLIVEDGTGTLAAESYISVADADTRQAALGMTNWATMSTAEKEQALRRATQYMLQRYRHRWIGDRAVTGQALDWPRTGVWVDGAEVDDESVPDDIANVCSDLALRGAAGPLMDDLTQKVVKQTVGPISREFSYASPQATRFPAIEAALKPYVIGGRRVYR